ncbi:hypothetical protein NEAUS04_0433 [Nematocida ausubeli]|uniref:Uncharacterized protein n=1 Tax=Nematocida ausubeli (strain ATCC PRA-371 / ERTm2) TaxID=1913371 RepID=H8ZBS0_NEMA1|nr:hypothetical protein NERG_01019 [Nematocida ausubeli]KAI5137433.1 hypothetical protein NEAUS06_2234 [Nematocida ausubeli]KAI5147040.1 hypothetical protein NEAUS05_0371 [Nematocida ausubeli]KAI5161319.1 hypothetical protein NEAUS04_0433 [Nematocida ausubeli]KAI5161880.1 hypothetical protein NEAUS03_1807 [Nematocida ausubeli]
MQECKKNLDIINSILEDSGVVRYNAMKNRFRNESTDSQTLLCLYRNTEKEHMEGSAIDLYRTNLQKLRRKIEERRLKITETIRNGVTTEEMEETVSVRNEEEIVTISPNGTATPFVPDNSIPKYTLNVEDVKSPDDFKYATVVGTIDVLMDKKKYKSELKLDGTILETRIADKKKGTETVVSVDITLAKLFIIAKSNKTFLRCMQKPSKHIYLHKEIDIVNITNGSPAELILKNINIGMFIKEKIKTFEFFVQDVYNSKLSYKTSNPDEFLRWLLLIKSRMYTVDKWSKDELLQTIRK